MCATLFRRGLAMIEQVRPLLDFILWPESRGDYNVVWGGIGKRHKPPRPLTEMTIREVLDWQDSIDPFYLSEAAGGYQIMEDTLRGLYHSAGMTLDDLFDEEGQDRLALALLRRRGLDDFLAMRITGEKFANNLAKEWASLPVVSGPKKGRSYYSGDGLNKSHVSVNDFMAAVMAIREPIKAPGEGGDLISALIAAILSLFGGKNAKDV